MEFLEASRDRSENERHTLRNMQPSRLAREDRNRISSQSPRTLIRAALWMFPAPGFVGGFSVAVLTTAHNLGHVGRHRGMSPDVRRRKATPAVVDRCRSVALSKIACPEREAAPYLK